MIRDDRQRPVKRVSPLSLRRDGGRPHRSYGSLESSSHFSRNVLLGAGVLGLLTTIVLSSDSDNLEKHLHQGDGQEDSIQSDSMQRNSSDKNHFTAFVDEYAQQITGIARKYDLPAELITSVLNTENLGRSYDDDLGDMFGRMLAKNVSLGPMQIRPSVAMSLDRMATGSVKGNVREYLAILQDPEQNLDYGARFLAHLRNGMYPGLGAEEILHHPEAMLMIASQYTTGEQRLPQATCDGWFSLGNVIAMPEAVQRTGTERSRDRAFRAIDDYISQKGRTYMTRNCPTDLTMIPRYRR
ncbi:hypothetical protein HYT52_04565 [Candidatus Woesearchaeota archaeon]|nr:hypothetical protein [Candidatus Woesearchaeota archaeon]